MKKIYDFTYGDYQASVIFKIDTNIFTKEKAKETLDFFWKGCKWNEDIITEALKKYALEIIRVGSWYEYNEFGITEYFKDNEGFYPLNKETGINLLRFEFMELEEDCLSLEIREVQEGEEIKQ